MTAIFSRATAAILVLCLVPAWAGKPSSNKPPVVSLTAPASGATFSAPATVAISANASDPDGTVTRVDFYQGSALIGSSSAGPYSMVWKNVPAGTFSLTAKALDNAGATTTSSAVSVTVTGTVGLISTPANGAALYRTGSVTLTGTFTGDPNTTTVLADNGNSTRVATLSGNNYYVTLPLFSGPNKLTVVAARRDKTFDTASITVSGNDAPVVTFKSPTTKNFDTPVTITVEADAVSPGGSISRVDLAQNGSLLAAVTTPPYRYVWNNVPGGNYSLSAQATDNNGVSATAYRSITVTAPNVLPSATLSAPLDGSAFYAPANLTLQANASDSDGSVAMVEFLLNGNLLGTSYVSPYSFDWTNVPAGTYTLSARATDNRNGATISSPITISVITPNNLPSVALTSPANGATFTTPIDITLTATASDSDGTVTRVDFYQDSIYAGSATSPPYAFTVPQVTAGTHAYTARATDDRGGSTLSSPVNVTVNGPPPPTISLTSPANGTTFNAPADITLAATANAANGSIANVSFYKDGALIGSASSAPYIFTLPQVPAGTYSFSARATDDHGTSAQSLSLTVVVVEPPPTVSITSPVNGATFTTPTDITLTASASSPNGTLTSVNFYMDGTFLGSVTSAPYAFTLPQVQAGTYSFTARATDNKGGTALSSPVSVTVNDPPPNAPPTVSLTSPASGIAYFVPTNVSLAATAADSDGSVTKVEFYQGTTLLGTVAAAPYAFNWTNVAAGTYSIVAKATDNLGAVTSSQPITISVVTPQIVVTSPTNGASPGATRVTVMGTINAPFNSGVTVNDQVAALDDNNNFFADIPLVAGSNSITATLHTQSGENYTQTLTVYSDGVPLFLDVKADVLEAIAPAQLSFTLTNNGSGYATVQFNSSQPFSLPQGETTTFTAGYSAPGVYDVSFTASYSTGRTETQIYKVVVHGAIQMDHMFSALWNGMNNALIAGDKASALTFLSAPAQDKYGPAFDVLMPDYNQIAASFSPLQRGSLSIEMGEYAVNQSDDGVNRLSLIYFVRGADGVWRLDGM